MERERREEALSPEQQNCSSGRKKNKTIQFRSDRQKKRKCSEEEEEGGAPPFSSNSNSCESRTFPLFLLPHAPRRGRKGVERKIYVFHRRVFLKKNLPRNSSACWKKGEGGKTESGKAVLSEREKGRRGEEGLAGGPDPIFSSPSTQEDRETRQTDPPPS